MAIDSLNITRRHCLLHKSWLWLNKIARVRHRLLRKTRRKTVGRLLKVRHGLTGLWRQIRVRARIEYVSHLTRLHLQHWRWHRSSLKSDMSSSIGSSAILKSRGSEYHALAVAFAVTFRLDAILAYWTILAALDAPFTTSQTSRLGSLAGEFGPESCLCLGGISAFQGDLVVAVIVRRSLPTTAIEVSLLRERGAIRCHSRSTFFDQSRC
jgi:hypothetical protein